MLWTGSGRTLAKPIFFANKLTHLLNCRLSLNNTTPLLESHTYYGI